MESNNKMIKVLSVAILVTGVIMFLSYLVYLPAPALFESQGVNNLGLIFYSLATAGAAFVCWGLILSKMDTTGLNKKEILKATGIGFGLLGIMRLGTALFPHAPFDQLVALPIVEFFLFGFLGFKLYRSQE